MTVDEAINHGIRLLHAAEAETNLALMERLNLLGDSWLFLASIINEANRG